jgi:hypothetical protein
LRQTFSSQKAMPPILILSFIAQIFCVIHALRNGNQNWIWILIIAPGIGCAAYALSHVMPNLFGSYGIRRKARSVLRAIDPERDRRALSKNLDRAETVENKVKLAQEALQLRDFVQAKQLFSESMLGLYERDPDLMLGLARAQSGLGEHVEAAKTLDDLIVFNPDFKSVEGHLLYAQTQVALGNELKALEEYAALQSNFLGEQARYEYAELLIRTGRIDKARQVLETLQKRVSVSPAHYQKSQAEWLSKANTALKSL